MADVLEVLDAEDDDFVSSITHKFGDLGPDTVPSLEQFLQTHDDLHDRDEAPGASTAITKASCVAITPEKATQEPSDLGYSPVLKAQVGSPEFISPGSGEPEPEKLPASTPASSNSIPSSMDLSISSHAARAELQNELSTAKIAVLDQELWQKPDPAQVLQVKTCASPFSEAQGPALLKDKALPSGRPEMRLGDQIARPEGQMASTFKPSPTSSPGAVPSACPGPPN